MDPDAIVTQYLEKLETTFKNFNKAVDDIIKLLKKAKKEIRTQITQNRIPVSIPLHTLARKGTDQMDTSLKRKITDKNPKGENSNKTKLMKKSNKNNDSANKTNDTSGTIKTNETNNTIELNVEPKNKNSCEKSNETDARNNGNPNAADQNDKGTNDGIMAEIIQASQNYKDMVSKLATSAAKMNRLGKCALKKKDQDIICELFDKIIDVYINNNEESAKENSDKTNLETQSNDNNKSEEIQLHLQMMKQEKEDEDDIATAISEIINRPEINTVTEKQTEDSRVKTIQLEKRQEQTQQKTNNTYNYFDKYNASINQSKNLQTIANETRPPCPPSTTPSLQHSHYYNNQNSYNNQESTNKNFRYPSKRPYNRQTPHQRYPQPHQINQIQMQQINQQAYVTYQQYVRPQDTQIQTQMQGMFSQNPPYH